MSDGISIFNLEHVSMKISFKPDISEIQIYDEAKTTRILYIVICVFQLISSSIQIVNTWGDFDDIALYIFIVIFILFGVAFIYYVFLNSAQEVIKHDDILYYNENRILGLKFRYLKLKNGRTRVMNFKKNSKEIEVLKQYFKDYDIVLKY